MKNHRRFKRPPICEHFHSNGLRCQSPALRERRYCFFHQRMHDLRRFRLRHPHAKIQLPLLEDAESIQIAIQEVVDAITQDRIDSKRAGLLLYALQTASANLKNADFEPRKLREDSDPAEFSPVVKMLMEALELSPPEFIPGEPGYDKRPPASANGERADAATG